MDETLPVEDTTGPTGSTESTGETGPTGSTETTGPTGPVGQESILLDSLTGGTPAPPVILLTELMSDLSILRQQESTDRAKCALFTSPDLQGIRTKLTTWIAGGSQGSCDLVRVEIATPNVCSDGVVRNFFEYVQFVSDKTVSEHLASFQAILPDFEVGYRCSRSELVLCVTRIKV